MTRKEYNGWTNYETWCVNLWMGNGEGSQAYFSEMAEEAVKRNRDDMDRAKWELAESIKAYHEEALPDVQGFAADLLGAALSEVDWDEIAGNLIDNAKEALEA